MDSCSHEVEQRDQIVRHTLTGVLAVNVAVAAAKLVVGWLSGTISMVADGFHSLTDAAGNIVALVGVAVGARPPDEDHPYGHRKFEALAALTIGGFLALAAWEILKGSIERVRQGGAPEVTPLSLAVAVAAVVISAVVSHVERSRGKHLGSHILVADAEHTRSDVLSSLAVLASLGFTRLGYPQADVIAAIVITLIVVRAAAQILRANGVVLTDRVWRPKPEVRDVALSVPGVLSVHKVRSRETPDGGYADLHVQVDPDLPLYRAHIIGHMVERRLREELDFEEVLVHVEPPEGFETDWRPDDPGPSRDST